MLPTDPVNRASLETIETAQFVVCLDRPHPNLHTGLANQHDSYSTFIANRCLHGSGSRYNSGNRWFDSSIQVRIGCYVTTMFIFPLYSLLLAKMEDVVHCWNMDLLMDLLLSASMFSHCNLCSSQLVTHVFPPAIPSLMPSLMPSLLPSHLLCLPSCHPISHVSLLPSHVS